MTGPRRRYRGDTLLLETEFTCAEGLVAVIDFMPVREEGSRLIRIVEGRAGQVTLATRCTLRFNYGEAKPWIHNGAAHAVAVAGPNAVAIRGDGPIVISDGSCAARFTVAADRSAVD